MNWEIRKGDSTKSPIKTTVIPRWPRATPRLHSDEQYQGLNAARGIDFNKQSSSITNSLIKQAMTTSPGIQNCYNILSRSLVFNKNSKIMICKETGKHEPYTGVKKKKQITEMACARVQMSHLADKFLRSAITNVFKEFEKPWFKK